MVLAARVSLLLSVIAAILVVTIGGTFLSYGNALQADGMPTMARLMEWDGQLRYRYTVNDKVFENTDTLPKNFAGLDGNFVRVTYLRLNYAKSLLRLGKHHRDAGEKPNGTKSREMFSHRKRITDFGRKCSAATSN